MKRILVLTFALFLILGLTVNTNAQSNEQLSVMTAKAYSMGGAFTGVADDVGAVLFNPAGLTQSGVVGFQGNAGVSDVDQINNYTKLAELLDKENLDSDDVRDIKDNFDKLMDSSVGMQAFAGGNLKSVALSANVKSNFTIKEGTTTKEKVLENNNDISAIISYGSKLASPPGDLASLAYGFNIKMTQHNYNKYDYDIIKKETINEITAQGNSIDLDFGVLAKMTDVLKVGAQIENLYSSGYDLETDSGKIYKEGLKSKRNMSVGASFEIPVVGTTLAADLENIGPISESDEMIYHFGVQQNLFLNLISLRAGTYGPEINGENSIYTAGIGLNLTKLHLDAAVGTDESGNNMSGMISGRFKF